jgi:hypothetical protein
LNRSSKRKRSQYPLVHFSLFPLWILISIWTDDDTFGEKGGVEDPTIFPFDTSADDHCESPKEAYQHILPLLQFYAKKIHPKEPKSHLSIYDPYYCNGAVKQHLTLLGFPNVYNCKEDCYKVWNDPSKIPPHDIFMTNPPYSGCHIEQLMKHVTCSKHGNRPWMLLMPNFVHKKDFFELLTRQSGQLPIYLVPRKRYVYQPPANFRPYKTSDTHKKSSPFVSMWHLWGGNSQVTDEWYRVLSQEHSGAFDVARSKNSLRDLRRVAQQSKQEGRDNKND